MSRYTILGVRFEALSECEADSRLSNALRGQRSITVFTPNALMLYKSSKDARLVSLLNRADLLLPDGVGISLACKLTKKPRVERITGIDTAWRLLGEAERTGASVFLLGGKAGVASAAARRIKKSFPRLNICGTQHGYFDKSPSSAESKAVLKGIRRASPDILFVCLGFPTQEAWIMRNKKHLPTVKIFMGLGGSLDVWSGKVKRAPIFVQEMGLEWLWRCVKEPKRIKDALSLPCFLIEVKKEKLSKNRTAPPFKV